MIELNQMVQGLLRIDMKYKIPELELL